MPGTDRPTEEPGDLPRLRGEVVYLYAFDVANEIRLDRVGTFLSGRPAAFVAHPDRSAPRSAQISRPLEVELLPAAVRVNGLPIRLLVRIYKVGVVSITVGTAFACDALGVLHSHHTPKLDDGQPLDAWVRDLCKQITSRLGASLVRPGSVGEPEAYTVFLLTDLSEGRDANGWLASHRRQVAGLLAEAQPDRLSDQQVEEVLRLSRSYETTDLVVIDWDAALVIDLDGNAEDVLFVLELANLQLEEFRWMDQVLDRYLEQAYEDMARRRWWAFGAAATVLRALRRLRVDLARLADEVAHTTKFLGDWHLARVYAMARERFHLDQWRASVADRLGQLDELYTLTRGELYDRRMLWLEVVIIVFFAADLLLLLLVKR